MKCNVLLINSEDEDLAQRMTSMKTIALGKPYLSLKSLCQGLSFKIIDFMLRGGIELRRLMLLAPLAYRDMWV